MNGLDLMVTRSSKDGKPAPSSAASERTRLLLHGPIFLTLLSLAAPTVALMTFQAVVHAAEGYFVGFLGADALAGISLSFPLMMLMTTMSAGAFGGGVSSAIARSIGTGRRDEAVRLAGNALSLSAVFGGAFTGAMLIWGPAIYAGLGATGKALQLATEYSNVLFLGAIPFWIFQATASCLRASGDTRYPATVGALGGIITLTVSPALIFGIGPLPGMGLTGAAWAVIAYNVVSALLLLSAFRAEGSLFRGAFASLWPDQKMMLTILRVAVPSAINTLQSNLTFLALTALVAPFGTEAIAGYGMGGRLEFLLIPVVFGVGSALIPLISANAGAGHGDRVRQATRAGLVLGTGAGLGVGLTSALVPAVWMGLFTSDQTVLAAGKSYLHIVGPAYFAFGGGLVCFFAAQGSGRVVQSLAAGFTRLLTAAIGGYIATRILGYGLDSLFAVMATGLLLYGAVMIFVTRRELGLVRTEDVTIPLADSINHTGLVAIEMNH